VNIKKLPLISHKAAANWTDALKVLAAGGGDKHHFSLVLLGPLVRNLGALFCSRTNEQRQRNPVTPSDTHG
jgi:hypothetical protein